MLVCNKCGSRNLNVLDKRNSKTTEYIGRIRVCADCGNRFSTIELERENYEDIKLKSEMAQIQAKISNDKRDKYKFPSILLILLAENKMSQARLSETINVTPSTISSWIQEMTMPNAYSLMEIAKVFHVTIDYLIFGGN